ncbi:MAG: hypothetical protein EZS28_027279 [Streblomastix strix]|uniref:Uncharacterized protein n=1 Tax=Streblomastix strix TaxID=222440 RepID=A0A5J4V3W8_9EUKA|nr:MAG: hypothetical protein EZS28_027279 [Streblomastix strix]
MANTGGSPIAATESSRATGSTVSTPTHPYDSENSKHTNGKEDTSVEDPPVLAISTVEACTHEDGIMNDNPGRKCRRHSPWKQDMKVKKAPATRMNDCCLIRGNKGEEIFRKRREDLLNVEDPELVIANFISQLEAEDSTNTNQTDCRSALSTLFQLRGFMMEKINGIALQQIMKNPYAGMRNRIKEEQLPKGIWQVKTAVFQGACYGCYNFIHTFRLPEHLPNKMVEFLDELKKDKRPKASYLVVIFKEQSRIIQGNIEISSNRYESIQDHHRMHSHFDQIFLNHQIDRLRRNES